MGFLKKRKEKRRMKKQQKNIQADLYSLYIQWTAQPEYIDAEIGEKYYKGENDIRLRKQFKLIDGKTLPEPDLPNTKLSHNWGNYLINQKINYCLAKSPKFECEDEQYLEYFNNWCEENNFNYWLRFLGTQASIEGRSWLFPYIDDNGDFKAQVFGFKECIPIWTDQLHTDLKGVIRVYTTTGTGLNLPQGDTHLEYWTAEGCQSYIVQGRALVLENNTFTELDLIDGKFNGFEPDFLNNKNPHTWGKTPFICFKNNIIEQSDIIPIKSLIDNFDFVRSDLANTLEKFVNSIITISNAQGTDLDEFIHNLKLYGVAKVDNVSQQGSGANIGVISQPIDCEASTTHTNLLEESIIKLSGAFHLPKTGQVPPSGVALKLFYQGLEIKCNGLESQFKLAFNQFQYFFMQYLKIKYNFTPSAKIKLSFDINSIMNENEQADTLNKQMDAMRKAKGVVSDETLYNNHPWVKDAQEEIKKVSKQNDDYFGKGDLNKYGL